MKFSFGILFFASLLFVNVLPAQNDYFYQNNEKISVEEDKGSLSVYFSQDLPVDEIFNLSHPFIKKSEIIKNDTIGQAIIYLHQPEEGKLDQLVKDITFNPLYLISASWGLKTEQGNVWLSNVIRFRENKEFEEVIFNDILTGYPDFSLIERRRGKKIVFLNDMQMILSLANELYESGMFKYVEPEFMIQVEEDEVLFSDSDLVEGTEVSVTSSEELK